ncbi:MAG: hypothetical protein IIC73_08840, partial [Armatimonadetes bacterium]|nr:hypothetical protein [Armatimonadota bacterium]
ALFVCLPLIAGAQNFPDVKIDFSAQGERLEIVLDRLAEEMGLTIDVDATIADEIMVIDVHGVIPLDLLNRIVQVANARMRGDTKNIRIERSPKIERELREASVTRRAAAVTKYLEQFDEALDSPFTGQEAASVRQTLELIGERMTADPYDPNAGSGLRAAFARGPQARLLHRLLRTIDPALLVDLEYAERRVFALSPTALQYGLGKGAKEAFDQYVIEQSVWAATVAGYDSPINDGANPLHHADPISAPPYDWWIVVGKGGSATVISASLVARRPGGRPVTMCQAMPPGGRATAMSLFLNRQQSIPDDMAGLLRELAEATLGMVTAEPIALSEEAREFVMRPTEGDVGGLIASYVLKRRHPKKDIVALLPDEALDVPAFLLSLLGSPELFDRALTEGLNLKAESVGDWLLVVPEDPYLATHERTPRAALQTYLRDTVKAGRSTLLNYSKLAAKTSRPSTTAQFLSRLLGLPTEGTFGVQRAWNPVKLYGLLVPVQRTALEQGLAIKYSNLTPSQRKAFLRIAVSQVIDNREPLPDGKQGFLLVGQRVEPTEWLSGAILADTELTMRANNEPIVFGYQKTEDGYKVFSSFFPRNIAMYERARKDPSASPPTIVIPDAWAMGVRRTISFKLQYAESKWQLFELTEEATDPDAKPGPWDKLPQEIADAITNSLAGHKSKTPSHLH